MSTAAPTESPTGTAIPSVTHTPIPTQINPSPTATIQRNKIPPSQTPPPIPPVNFLTAFSALPEDQYLLYWDFPRNRRFCQLNAVSKSGDVYPLVGAHCGAGAENHQTIASVNGLFIVIPFYEDTFLFHLKDKKWEKLAPTNRMDCVITSISPDGMRFAGRCGDLEDKLTLGVRTLEADWTVLQPFESGNEGDVMFTTAWSPDGKKLAFFNQGTLIQERYVEGVFVVDVDACIHDPSTCSAHVTGPHYEPMPYYVDWSPDSHQFVVPLSREIYIVDENMKKIREVTVKNEGRSPIHGAAWSPDGNWIGYCVDKDWEQGGSEIRVASLVSGTTLSLTEPEGCMVVGWLNIEP